MAAKTGSEGSKSPARSSSGAKSSSTGAKTAGSTRSSARSDTKTVEAAAESPAESAPVIPAESEKEIAASVAESHADDEFLAESPDVSPEASDASDADESTDETPEPEPETWKKRFSARMLEWRSSTVSEADKARKKLMKRFRRAKNIPSEDEVERFTPDLRKGLTSEQVETRFNQFLFNDVNKRYSKSYLSIFIGNICTFFNLLCVLVAVALIIAHAHITQFLFVVIFTANLVIGIVQEILAKKQVDKLSVLVSATAKVFRSGARVDVPVREIVLDDVLFLEIGQQIPADCILAEGVVEVNESLLTGESVPVKKTIGDMLYAGSYVSSGACYVRVDKVGKNTYLNSLTSKAKKYKKPKSEIMNSIRLFIRVIAVLIPVIAGLMFWVNWEQTMHNLDQSIQFTAAIVIGMIPSGLLLLTSLAMALGVLRLAKQHTLVQDLYSLEMLARVNVLCLDKTGTITDGRMTVNDCLILGDPTDSSVDEIISSMLAALDDNNQTSIALATRFGTSGSLKPTAIIPFSSKRKLSAVTFSGCGTFAMGAPEFVLRPMPPKVDRIVQQYAQMGLRVLVLAHASGSINKDKLPSSFRPVALITLADNIRSDAVETIKWFRENDVEIKIISGDNPVTVSEVARRVGVKDANRYISLDGLTDLEVENIANQYTVFGRVTPEQKAILVRAIKKQGNTVAMTGDGVNDILALKEADCAVSVASGSEAARNVSHIVLTDNNFLNLPSVVYEGRRVINNIKSGASLYIMKTLFTTILAVICAIMGSPYFFKTNNLLLFETLVAAVPSLVIALQPNTNRVRGKFILYVLSRSIPGALTLILCVMGVYLGIRFMPEQLGTTLWVNNEVGGDICPLLALAVNFGGMVMLLRILQPLNVLRAVVYVLSLGVSIVMLAIPALGNLIYTGWSSVVDGFNLTQIMFLICILLTAFPISKWLINLGDLMNPD